MLALDVPDVSLIASSAPSRVAVSEGFGRCRQQTKVQVFVGERRTATDAALPNGKPSTAC